MRWEVSGRKAAALWDVASRIRSIELVAFLCGSRLVQFSIRLFSVHVVHPYIRIDTTAAWKILLFILSGNSDFHMIDILSIAVHDFASRILMSFSVDETLHPQTDCFVLSELFSVARHVGRSKPGSKPIQLYVRLSLRPLDQKSDLIDKMKRSFFQAAVVSILLYGCTTWTLTKRLKKKLDGNYTRMLRAILNKSW